MEVSKFIDLILLLFFVIIISLYIGYKLSQKEIFIVNTNEIIKEEAVRLAFQDINKENLKKSVKHLNHILNEYKQKGIVIIGTQILSSHNSKVILITDEVKRKIVNEK